MEQKKGKKYIVGSILCGLLTAFGIAASVISLIGGSKGLWFFNDCLQLLLLLLIIFYAFVGYKKPHGNLLKWIILFYAALYLLIIQRMIQLGNDLAIIKDAIEIGLLCYSAGRLQKAKENLILMIIVTISRVSALITSIVLGVVNIGVVTFLIIWLDICVAYFLRYKQHREAGLEDAPKK